MKVKRTEWEALQAKVSRLESDLRITQMNQLIQLDTGPLLASVAVSMLLRHFKLEARHGYGELFPTEVP